MKLSIGVTSYNQVTYVEETIKSLIRQSEKPYEIVVSDNHSTDGSFELLKKYQDKITLIQPPSHLDYPHHLQFLVENLHGDWCLLSASDDTYHHDFVQVAHRSIKPEASIIRFNYNIIDEDGNLIRKLPPSKTIRRCCKFPSNMIESLYQNSVPIWASIFNVPMLKKVGVIDENIKMDQDWGIVFRMAEEGPFLYVPKNICNYRRNYRPDQAYHRREPESFDAAYISNFVQKPIFEKNNLSMRFWKKARLMNLNNRIRLYKTYNESIDHLFELFGVSVEDFNDFSAFDRFILKLRTKYLKR